MMIALLIMTPIALAVGTGLAFYCSYRLQLRKAKKKYEQAHKRFDKPVSA